MKTLSVILPAHNEADLIGPCLDALLGSGTLPEGWHAEVIVVANGCSDTTAAIAIDHRPVAANRGWDLQVIDVAKGGKLNALNLGDETAQGEIRVYLDADVLVSAALLGQLTSALDQPVPRYASGQARISPGSSRFSAWYSQFWITLPFVQTSVPGFGLFAMNAPGRARWGYWPDIISDDTFARLNFAPDERVAVPAWYQWPIVQGFTNLVRVRRRQNRGVQEITTGFPALTLNDDKPRLSPGGLIRRIMRDPLGFAAYASVSLAVKTPLFRSGTNWARGR